MTSPDRFAITRWTAVFTDRGMEGAYRLAHLSELRGMAIWVTIACTGYYVLSILSHLTGPDATITLDSVLGRLAAVAGAVVAIAAIRRARTPQTIELIVMAMAVFLITVNLTAIPLRSNFQVGSAVSILGAVMVVYLFLPVPLTVRLGVSAYTSIAGLVLWTYHQTPEPLASDASRLALWLAAINGLGYFTANRHTAGRRRNYALLQAQSASLARLQAEMVERTRAEEALREAKEAAEAAARAKSEFLAMMSHEIRTPMNGILGMVRLLLAGPLPPQQRDYAETIHQSGRSLLTILNDILDLSKIEAGRLDVQPQDVELRPLIQGVADLMRSRAAEKGLALDTDLPPDLPAWVCADPTRLRQVLLNLIGNAVKFTERGRVTVSAALAGGSAKRPLVRFEVRDTGIGVPAAGREALFQPFTQADATISRRFGGTGLGLAICRRLVDLMGGEIGLDDGDGPGRAFWFVLPLPLAEARRIAEDDAAGGAVAPLRILLAEDNEVNQMVAVGFLSRRGHMIDLAGDGADAVRMLQAGDYDVVLMDVHMPGTDGLEATRRIRDLPGAKARIPIIAMTADAMRGDAERCLAAGMDDYVAKPIDPAALDAALARANTAVRREAAQA